MKNFPKNISLPIFKSKVMNNGGIGCEEFIFSAPFPDFLVNGFFGADIGLATNIPPHNVSEVIDACLALLRNPDIDIEKLIDLVHAPDFPTADFICGLEGAKNAYRTGRGQIILRGRTHFEDIDSGERKAIIIDELPYQVKKDTFLNQINTQVSNKTLEGICDILDESDEFKMRLVIILKRYENAKVVLNRLYKYSQLQSRFDIKMVAVIDGLPKSLNLKQIIEEFLRHRRKAVTCRAISELCKASKSGDMLEDCAVTSNVEEIAAIINSSPTQTDFMDILANSERVTAIVVEELIAVKAQFSEKRRSEIITHPHDISMGDLITPKEVVVTLSHTGYVQYKGIEAYRVARRGGRGRLYAGRYIDGYIDKFLIVNTHNYILCFSNLGRVYWLKVYELPIANYISRGMPIVNLLQMEEGEKINAILPVSEFLEDKFVFFATAGGTVKKTPLTDFSRPMKRGIIAINLDEGDHLIGVAVTDGKHDIMLFSNGGKAVRFDEDDVRPTGRASRGVRGMKLASNQQVISLLVAENEQQSVLIATENGYGKRSLVSEYTRHERGTQGMIAIQTSERNGKVVAATLVSVEEEIMLIGTSGMLFRTRVIAIHKMGRLTQGRKMLKMENEEKLAGVSQICEET